MFNRHDPAFGKERFGIVVDQLSINKDVAIVCQNTVHLVLHLGLFGLFDGSNLIDAVHFDPGSVNFDFIRIHGCVGDENFGVFHALGLSRPDGLVEQESFFEIAVPEDATGLFQNLNVFQIATALESEDGVDGEIGKVRLFVREQFATKSSGGDLQELFAEDVLVGGLLGGVEEGLACHLSGQTPSGTDRLGVDSLRDKLFSFPQEFSAEHRDGSRPVADFVVLDPGNVDEDLGGGVVHVYGAENGGTVVGDGNTLIVRIHLLEDLVQSFGSQRRLDEIGNRNGTDEGTQTSVFALERNQKKKNPKGVSRIRLPTKTRFRIVRDL